MLRSLARAVAHSNMKKKELRKVNKKTGEDRESFFSNHWKEYLKIGGKKHGRNQK